MRPLDFERVVVDGIPAYVANDTGPITAGLAFRVGTADEQPLERGITALVAELAAIEADAAFEIDETVTSLVVSGDAKHVGAALNTMCSTLLTLDAQDLADLADTIAGQVGAPSYRNDALGMLYGARTYGIASLPPLFVLHPSLSAAQAWATRWFTRANAILWSTGPLPADVALPLGGGSRHDAPDRSPEFVAPPAWYVVERHYVSAYAVVTPSPATVVALRAIANEIRDRASNTLLDGAALECHVVPWSADAGLVSIELDASRDVNEGIELVLGTIDDFAESGPEPDELAEAAGDIEDWALRRENAEAVGALLSRDELASGRARTLDEYLAGVAAVSGGQLAQAAGAIRDEMLVTVPDGGEIIDERFEEVEPTAETIAGTQYGAADIEGDPEQFDTLVVGHEGVSLTLFESVTTVYFDSCIAAVRYTDDTIALYSNDGTSLAVVAEEWRDGHDAVAAIDAALTTDGVLRVDRPFRATAGDAAR